MADSNATIEAEVTRGRESWDYIYVALGFALAIEGSTIQMMDWLKFPWNVVAYVAIGYWTFRRFLFNAGFQNWLIGVKNRYEIAARRMI